jgi:ribosomal protein S18 acetylase RimI-like enzyme
MPWRWTATTTSGWLACGTGRGRGRNLGLVGVLSAYRRRGLATALLARVFGPLAERGERVVTAEADAADVASAALLGKLGGRVVGGTVEFHRPAQVAG